MMVPGPDDRYVENAARMNQAVAIGASVIGLLTMIEVWGNWGGFALVAALLVALTAFNMWITFRVLPRSVLVAESLRMLCNTAGVVAIALSIGMPTASWLWPPFIALTFDHDRPRAAAGMLFGFAAVLVGLAILQDVPWIFPVLANGFAAVCLVISRARTSTIRGMLVRSDQQRHALEAAHADLAATHARLIDEVRTREQIEVELRQAQKLEAIGRLAAGIAHEINTPVQFVSDSIHFVDDATRDLLILAATSRSTMQTLLGGSSVADAVEAIVQAEAAADLPYVSEQLPPAIARVLDGLDRISTIVRSMKEFAHPDLKHPVAADLNRALLATITIAAHEYRLVADVDFVPGDLPNVTCRPGELNQVFLNLIVNAAHAIGDVVKTTGAKGRIAIRTRTDGDHAVITIADTGGGIPEAIRGQIFDPFFTTKEVGRGTGQGLAIAHTVMRQHGGQLTFASEVGHGTTFELRLPIDGVPEPIAPPPRALSTRSTGSPPPTPAN